MSEIGKYGGFDPDSFPEFMKPNPDKLSSETQKVVEARVYEILGVDPVELTIDTDACVSIQKIRHYQKADKRIEIRRVYKSVEGDTEDEYPYSVTFADHEGRPDQSYSEVWLGRYGEVSYFPTNNPIYYNVDPDDTSAVKELESFLVTQGHVLNAADLANILGDLAKEFAPELRASTRGYFFFKDYVERKSADPQSTTEQVAQHFKQLINTLLGQTPKIKSSSQEKSIYVGDRRVSVSMNEEYIDTPEYRKEISIVSRPSTQALVSPKSAADLISSFFVITNGVASYREHQRDIRPQDHPKGLEGFIDDIKLANAIGQNTPSEATAQEWLELLDNFDKD